MELVNFAVACCFLTFGHCVVVDDIPFGGSEAKETTVIVVGIDFGGAVATTFDGDVSTESAEVSEIGATACPLCVRDGIDASVVKSIVDVSCIYEGIGPERCG